MSLTRTTISAAITADATTIQVTSATGFSAGYLARINDEFVHVNQVDGTTVKVQRGKQGTPGRAHGILSVIVVGPYADFLEDSAYTPHTYTYGAAGAITPKPGLHRLAAASAAAMTLVAPTADQEGQKLLFVATAAQAYTITLGSGYFNGATNTVATWAAAIGNCLEIIAINGNWCVTLNKNITLSAS